MKSCHNVTAVRFVVNERSYQVVSMRVEDGLVRPKHGWWVCQFLNGEIQQIAILCRHTIGQIPGFTES